MTTVLHTIDQMREQIRLLRSQNKTIGLVPTMGYLHDGHMSLIERSAEENDKTVVSIFVNPAQFGVNEDYDSYPRNLEHDLQKIGTQADFVFAPNSQMMYPDDFVTGVTTSRYSEGLCGDARPGHFNGVVTVVTKLLNIVTPDRAYFGQKDIQQYRIIRQLVKDLNINTAVYSCPIVRELDGLAMSSRNSYLTEEQRAQATVLHRSLQDALQLIEQGEMDIQKIRAVIEETIATAPLAVVDYIECRQFDSWQPVERIDNTRDTRQYVLAMAVKFGNTRLLDNVLFGGRMD